MAKSSSAMKRSSAMGGGGSATVQVQSGGSPQLDSDLISRANSAGMFVDYGDAGVRQYRKHLSPAHLNLQ